MAKDGDCLKALEVAARKAEAKQRKQAEALRMVRVKAKGAAPADCGPDVLKVVPARGPLISVKMRGMVPDPKQPGRFKMQDMSHLGRRTIREADTFDRMNGQARKVKGALIPHHLIEAGRAYRNLVERCEAAGIKTSSTLDGGARGGGDTDKDWMDHHLARKARLKWCHDQIGHDTALVIKRRRPSKRGGKALARQNIPTRQLVDMVCIADMSLSEVLRAYGWSVKVENLEVLRGVLCAALERLRG